MHEEWLTSQKILLRWISNSIKLYCNQSGCAVLRSVKQCLRETAATIPWLCVLEGRLKTSPGRLWYSKQAKNAVQWKQKPLYNIPRIHRLSYRERSWINLRKNSTSVTRNTWEIPSPETTECYENILGKATTPQPCHLLLGRPWAK